MVIKRFFHFINFTNWVSQRYTADCTDSKAHDGVATPWNRITIPRCLYGHRQGARAGHGSFVASCPAP